MTLRSALSPGSTTPRSRRPYTRGRLAGEDLDRGLERDGAAGALAHPVGEEERRVAGVADEVDVGAAVAETEHGLRVHEQLGADVEVAGVAAEEVVHERVAVVGDGPVVEERPRDRGRARRPARRGWSTDRARTPGPGATGTPTSACASIRSRSRGTPGGGRSARMAAFDVGLGHAGGALGDRQVLDRVVGGAAAERVPRAQPAEQALPVRAHLRDDAGAVRVLAFDAGEAVAPCAALRRRTGT